MASIKVGLLGFGTVGAGVVKVLQENGGLLERRLGAPVELVRIVDLDIATPRPITVDPALLSTDAATVLDSPAIDIVIELIGGYEPARTFVLRAIANGKHVVTANKALLALHGDEIFAGGGSRPGSTSCSRRRSAAGFRSSAQSRKISVPTAFSSVFGILNGTCNYILTRMTERWRGLCHGPCGCPGEGLCRSGSDLRCRGDRHRPQAGLADAACASARGSTSTASIREGITRITALDIEFAREFGYTLQAAGHRQARQWPDRGPCPSDHAAA